MTEQESMFDDNNNMHVPIERVLDNLMERNKQLNLEVATLQAGNQMLREKILELESS
jgi:chaperonin cofactor prefoldin